MTISATFREAQTSQEVPEKPEKPAEVTGVVLDKENIPREIKPSTLEDWETVNGKYGLSYLGIQNIAETFPIKINFAQLDKYVKAEMAERGVDATPENWQNILKEIEGEIGVEKDSYKRLQKLADYIKVVNRMKALKKLKEKYLT